MINVQSMRTALSGGVSRLEMKHVVEISKSIELFINFRYQIILMKFR